MEAPGCSRIRGRLAYPYKCVHFCQHSHTYMCFLSCIHSFDASFLHWISSGSQHVTVLLCIGHVSHLAGEVAHFSLLHNLSDFPPVKNTATMSPGPILSLIIIYLRSQSRGESGRRALTACSRAWCFTIWATLGSAQHESLI